MEKPLFVVRRASGSGANTPAQPPIVAGQGVTDRRSRPLHDLRISVTDRCNFRCSYCMPREIFGVDHPFVPQSQLLRFEEIARLANIFAQLGVRKLRITGGEPLMRKHLHRLIGTLSELRTPQGQALDIALTTNGSLLARQAAGLRAAGLRRVTVSLDALDPELFARLSDSTATVQQVLQGIHAATEVGLAPVKINMVVQRGVNDHQIVPMARYFRGSGHILRFIEYMDVGTSNGWQPHEVLTGTDILQRIAEVFPLERLPQNHAGEVAERWRYTDGQGEIGVITSISQAFCSSCNRARLSPEGQLFLCLFAGQGYDLRQLLRDGASDAELSTAIQSIWRSRNDAYSEERGLTPSGPRVEMSYIGG